MRDAIPIKLRIFVDDVRWRLNSRAACSNRSLQIRSKVRWLFSSSEDRQANRRGLQLVRVTLLRQFPARRQQAMRMGNA